MPTPSLTHPTSTIHLQPSWAEVLDLGKADQNHSGQETIGERLARLRRERGLTQVEVAEKLNVAQPVVSDYERGELRLHGQLIVDLSHILGVSADELLGIEKPKSTAVIKNRRLRRRIQDLEHLPRRDQQALLRTIDAFLTKAR